MVARDMMSWVVVTAQPTMTLRQLATIFLEYGFNAVPVVNEQDQLIGMAGIRDLLTAPYRAASGQAVEDDTTSEQKLAIWESTPVRQVMATPVISVTEDTPLGRIAALMASSGAHPLPVVRDGRPIGMISRREVIKAILNETGQMYRAVTS